MRNKSFSIYNYMNQNSEVKKMEISINPIKHCKFNIIRVGNLYIYTTISWLCWNGYDIRFTFYRRCVWSRFINTE